MSYVFLVPKNSIRCLKNVISGHFSIYFGFLTFYSTKRFVFEFQGESPSSYFWAILLIFAVITIWEDFGSLLPDRTVTVKPIVGR